MQIMTAPAPIRRRRFERAPEPPAFQLTSRDEDIIRAVARNRFLTSRQIQTLFAASTQNIIRRLNGLFHAGYLDRPRAQLDYYTTAGSAPMVYALADKGARLINRRDGATLPEDEWKRKIRAAGRPFIEHTLAIAELHTALVAACQTRPDVELVDAKALIAAFPKPPASHDRAFAWHTTIRRNDMTHKVPVKPDYAFALRSTAIGRRCYLAECDRGTMPIERADFNQTSIARKLIAYIHGHAGRMHETNFGWKAFRVLFITNTEERARNMRLALADITKAHNVRHLFYFAHADVITSTVQIDDPGSTQLTTGNQHLEAEVSRINKKRAQADVPATYHLVDKILDPNVWIDGNGQHVTLI
jgi:hypothetical protein